MIGVLVLLLEVPHHVTCGVAGLWLVGKGGLWAVAYYCFFTWLLRNDKKTEKKIQKPKPVVDGPPYRRSRWI